MKTKFKSYLTPQEVAKLLMVSPVTVRQLAQKGGLKAVTTPGGHRRFMRHEVERFAQQRGLTLDIGDDDTWRILIVDDDTQLANYLVEFFDNLSQKIVTQVSHDGFDAGMKVLAFKPHIVLLDLMMSGISGFKVCQTIKKDPITRGMRIIAITGYPSDENTKKILAAGAEACLSKPIDVTILLQTMGLQEQQAVCEAT